MRYWILRLAAASALVAIATVLTLNSLRFFPPGSSTFAFFFTAILVSGWFFGGRIALFSLMLSVLAFDYFFLIPIGSIDFKADTLPRLAIDSSVGLLITCLALARRRAQDRVEKNLLKLQAAEEEKTKLIEELNRFLSEKELLLQEIHHRVKNNLQLMNSFLNLQASSTGNLEARDILEESRTRIQAIALIHEALYNGAGNLSSVDFRDYLQTLTQYIAHSFLDNSKLVEITLGAETIIVPVQKAVALALIANELITNAFKHAFTDKNAGELDISLHSQNGVQYLEIADTGIGLPEDFQIDRAQSLGLRVVKMLTAQINGTLAIETRSPGSAFRVTFPSA